MKKLFLTVLAAAVLLASSASAASFTSLGKLQHFLMNHSPDELMASGAHSLTTEGKILEIHWCGLNNHYAMTLLVEDPTAITPIGAEGPQLTVSFRLHLEAPPFNVGDTITVSGSLNELYSSVMIPWILADTINGTDDF